MKGKLIVIEGLDGSGKATQTAKLCEALTAMGKTVRKLSFPRYEEESSALVRLYLGGAFGQKPGDVNCYAASSFYSVDRAASYLGDWKAGYEAGEIFITDRYTTSNAVYQTSKLEDESAWDAFVDWLFDFEYNKLGIPAPDATVFLDVSAETSEALMEKRYHGDENKKDIHERDIEYQRRCRKAACHCAERYGWKTVNCSAGGVLRSVEDIAQEVLRHALEVL